MTPKELEEYLKEPRQITQDFIKRMDEIVAKYRTKMWYELPENIGQIVKVRDDVWDTWRYGVFREYTPNVKYPYRACGSSWAHAEPVDSDEIIIKGGLDANK